MSKEVADFASVLDDLYATTPVDLHDVKEVPKPVKGISTMYVLGLLLIGLVLLVLLLRIKKEPQEMPQEEVHHSFAGSAASAVKEPTINWAEVVKKDKDTFQIHEALVFGEEDAEDQKLSADREESAILKYKQRT